jgi:hypothetical protein
VGWLSKPRHLTLARGSPCDDRFEPVLIHWMIADNHWALGPVRLSTEIVGIHSQFQNEGVSVHGIRRERRLAWSTMVHCICHPFCQSNIMQGPCPARASGSDKHFIKSFPNLTPRRSDVFLIATRGLMTSHQTIATLSVRRRHDLSVNTST